MTSLHASPVDNILDFLHEAVIGSDAPRPLPEVRAVEARQERRADKGRGLFGQPITVFHTEPITVSVQMGAWWLDVGFGLTEEEAAGMAALGLALRQGIGVLPLLYVLGGAPDA